MSDEIIKRLMEAKRSKSTIRFDEVDDEEDDRLNLDDIPGRDEEEDFDDPDSEDSMGDDPDYDREEDFDDPDSEDSMEDDDHAPPSMPHHSSPSSGDMDIGGEEEGGKGETHEPPEPAPDDDAKVYVNPLDNSYAVHYTIGDDVAMTYTNGSNTELVGTIDGYDTEGFYRVQWSNGFTTNGITDIALADFISKKNESVCVCGGSKFVNEGKYVVCDTCGRNIRENKTLDKLTLADKKRPRGKRMIRSEAHPVSTAIKPDISETIKQALKSK